MVGGVCVCCAVLCCVGEVGGCVCVGGWYRRRADRSVGKLHKSWVGVRALGEGLDHGIRQPDVGCVDRVVRFPNSRVPAGLGGEAAARGSGGSPQRGAAAGLLLQQVGGNNSAQHLCWARAGRGARAAPLWPLARAAA